jgi:hypothetical protein
MTIHLVTVTAPGNNRYFDSVWVRKENADKREKQLRDEFVRSGFDLQNKAYNYTNTQWATKIVTAEAIDGAIKDPAGDEAPHSLAVNDLKRGDPV